MEFEETRKLAKAKKEEARAAAVQLRDIDSQNAPLRAKIDKLKSALGTVDTQFEQLGEKLKAADQKRKQYINKGEGIANRITEKEDELNSLAQRLHFLIYLIFRRASVREQSVEKQRMLVTVSEEKLAELPSPETVKAQLTAVEKEIQSESSFLT